MRVESIGVSAQKKAIETSRSLSIRMRLSLLGKQYRSIFGP